MAAEIVSGPTLGGDQCRVSVKHNSYSPTKITVTASFVERTGPTSARFLSNGRAEIPSQNTAEITGARNGANSVEANLREF